MRAKPLRFNLTEVQRGTDTELPFCLSDRFRRALLQSSHRLLWSRAWVDENEQPAEIDEDTRSMIERGIWRLSQEDGCSDEVIMEQVINIQPAQQQQQQSCGCGGSGGNGGQSPDIPLPPGGGYFCFPLPIGNDENGDDSIPPVPSIEPPPLFEVDEERCRRANYVWQLFRNHLETVMGYVSGTQSAISIAMAIIAILPGGLLIRLGTATVLALAVSIVQLRDTLDLAALLFQPAIDWMDEQRETIVCKLYNAQAERPLAEWFWEQWFNVLDTVWEAVEMNQTLRDILWWLWKTKMVRQSIYGLALNAVVPDTWSMLNPVDCAICMTDVPELPATGDRWILVAAPVSAWNPTPNNGTAVQGYSGNGTFSHSPLTVETYHEVDAGMDVEEILAASAGIECAGLILRATSYAVPQFNNDGLSLSSNTGGSILFPAEDILDTWHFYYRSDWEAAYEGTIESQFSDFLDSFGEDVYPYGNGAVTDVKASFRSQTYGTSGAKGMTFQILYLLLVEA